MLRFVCLAMGIIALALSACSPPVVQEHRLSFLRAEQRPVQARLELYGLQMGITQETVHRVLTSQGFAQETEDGPYWRQSTYEFLFPGFDSAQGNAGLIRILYHRRWNRE